MALVYYDAMNYPGIRIDDPGGAETFALTCREALDRIVSKPFGKRMLSEICRYAPWFNLWSGCVKILRSRVRVMVMGRPGQEGGSRCSAVNEVDARNGTGSASGIHWNPNPWVAVGGGIRPPFIGLAHELVHAWHNAKGIKRPFYDPEEQFTIGIGPYAHLGVHMITENRIRFEHGIPARMQY